MWYTFNKRYSSFENSVSQSKIVSDSSFSIFKKRMKDAVKNNEENRRNALDSIRNIVIT